MLGGRNTVALTEVTSAMLVLLLENGSDVSELTDAVLEKESPDDRRGLTVTEIVYVLKPPAAMVPRLHVGVPFGSFVQLVVEGDCASDGSASVTTTFCASDGPRLSTRIVYTRLPPAATGSGAWLLAIWRSALVDTVFVSLPVLDPGPGSDTALLAVAVFVWLVVVDDGIV